MSKNKFVELAETKCSLIESVESQIRYTATELIRKTLKELNIEFTEIFNYMHKFTIEDVEFLIFAEKGSYQIKLTVHNMCLDINLLNHDVIKSDRIGTGIEDYYFKSVVVDQIKKICPNYKED